MIKVLLADDQELLRSGFRMILSGEPDFAVIGEAANGADAVTAAATLHPDVVLMDIRMPGVDGIEATKRIVDSGTATRVLILTTFDLDEYVYAALRAGASGFMLKDVPAPELCAAVRTVANGDAVVAPTATRRLLTKYAHQLPVDSERPTDPRLERLTRRELEVLVAVASGLSNSEIAESMFLSEGTVKSHLGKVLAKLELRDRVSAVIFAYEQRLVRPT
ncbi:MAG: response regulator transcription factor [Candidatus Nanopelagicales bacterium]|jgi:DNA-binding NarL/FixJ family response regulator